MKECIIIYDLGSLFGETDAPRTYRLGHDDQLHVARKAGPKSPWPTAILAAMEIQCKTN